MNNMYQLDNASRAYYSKLDHIFSDYADIYAPPAGTDAHEVYTTIHNRGVGIAEGLRAGLGIEAPIAFCILDDPNVQAIAARKDEGYVIGLHIGCAYHFLNTARSILSFNSICPSLGASSNEFKFDIKSRYQSDHNICIVPKISNPDRQDFAESIFNQCINFLLHHEFSHLIGGHTDIYAEKYGLNLVDSPLHISDTIAVTRERQSMEYFSDVRSFLICADVSIRRAIAKTGGEKADLRAAPFREMQALSLASFLVFAHFSPGEPDFDKDRSSYPPAAVRLASLQRTAFDAFAKLGIPYSEGYAALVQEPSDWAVRGLKLLGFEATDDFYAKTIKRENRKFIERIHRRTDRLVDGEFSNYALMKLDPYLPRGFKHARRW